MPRVEEGLAGREILDGVPIGFQHGAKLIADVAVVVDDVNDRPGENDGVDGLPRRPHAGADHRKQIGDDLQQLPRPDRFAEPRIMLERDIAQSTGRDVAGQDDDRDFPPQPFADFRGGLQAIHPVG